MNENIQTGLYLDDGFIYLVKTENGVPIEFSKNSFKEEDKQGESEANFLPGDFQASSQIEKFLKKQKIQHGPISLSLPTKDIIFRSFIIPSIPQNEIQGVVDFEANKYIPFSLKELTYCFHTMPFVKDRTRHIRIVFTAIKKNALENYTSLIEQAGVKINHIEPASLSLIRALMLKGHIEKDITAALIEREEHVGKIIIIDQGTPLFVREFQLRIPETQNEKNREQALLSRLTSEVRISLNYFNRQDSHLKTQKIFLLTFEENQQIYETIKKEINLPVMALTGSGILANNDYPMDSFGFLYAYGAACVAEQVEMPRELSFSKKEDSAPKPSRVIKKRPFRYKAVIGAALISVLTLTFSFFSLNKTITGPNKKVKGLEKKLGSKKLFSTKKVRQDISDLDKKMIALNNLEAKSYLAALLAMIPDMLPKGVWLEELVVDLTNTGDEDNQGTRRSMRNRSQSQEKVKQSSSPEPLKPTLLLSGYVYLENATAQFERVNTLLSNFENDRTFSKIFNIFSLDTIETKEINEHKTTFFKISIKTL